MQASGHFDVKLTPQPVHDEAAGALGRMAIDKRFFGELEATSRGEMLSAGTAVKGSAAYVAIEQVTGSVSGRRGRFVLQHSGSLSRGEAQLQVSVVPDSGTDELVGLTGTMTITITDSRHEYVFDYSLPDQA